MKKLMPLVLLAGVVLIGMGATGCGKAKRGRTTVNPAVRVQMAERLIFLKDRLKITNEQVKKFEKLRDDYRNNLIKTQQRSLVENQKLRMMYAEENIDFEAIRKQIETAAALDKELKTLRLNADEQSFKALMPEQQKQYLVVLESLKKETEERRKLAEERRKQLERARRAASKR